MTTLVSIILYAGALLFAMILGVAAEEHNNGSANANTGVFAFFATIILFVLAASLQVAS